MSQVGVKTHEVPPSVIAISSLRPGQSNFTFPVGTTRGPVVELGDPVAVTVAVTVVVETAKSL